MLTKNPRDFVVHFGYADRETSSMQWKVRKGSKWIAAEFSPRFWGGGRDELKAGEKVSFTVAIPKVIHSYQIISALIIDLIRTIILVRTINGNVMPWCSFVLKYIMIDNIMMARV